MTIDTSTNSAILEDTPTTPKKHQEPLAIVGFACRLPGDCNTPKDFWDFIVGGGIASRDPPASRFTLETHHDGSKKTGTMASPGGMFINADPRDIDASFFKLTRTEAIGTDPQQRQLLEVVYEGLENSGITLDEIHGKQIGCFVASFAGDYADIQARDPVNRATMSITGLPRALLANRVSHFLNIKGPSIAMDTACSGSLVAIDVANKYLQAREINGAIVAGCNLYMSPEHVNDPIASQGTASASGFCHAFDADADGYIKAEAVNMMFLKRLDDAIRDKNPIRGIIRSTATGANGWTAGIGSPDAEAQAAMVRQAYDRAGISDMTATDYIECHGTGTKAGDAAEVNGIASVFAQARKGLVPLHIGSVKGNIGHSEPAAGISGLLKATLAVEAGVIPGTATYITPSPSIDFHELNVRPSKVTVPWPTSADQRRCSVNSFGYGGANAHVIVDAVLENRSHTTSHSGPISSRMNQVADRPYIIALSANDEESLQNSATALKEHLSKPDVHVDLRDLAYTLSEKRTRHFYHGILVAKHAALDTGSMITGKVGQNAPRIGLIFTGQGAQWPEMGKDLITSFPVALSHLQSLNTVLQSLPDAPQWDLVTELSSPRSREQYQSPELSQTLTTALQLAILLLLKDCGLDYQAVVGHSSGEIVAATAARHLTPEHAIQLAYYRGKAASTTSFSVPVGMMAVGLGADQVNAYIDTKDHQVQIACVNSPKSVTLSGAREDLARLETDMKSKGHFARMLQVDAAYHSSYMQDAASRYRSFTETIDFRWEHVPNIPMYSSVTGSKLKEDVNGLEYWVRNMVSPVLFDAAVKEMLQVPLDMLIEIGPSGALSGPVSQIKQSVSSSIEYAAAWKRSSEAAQALCELVGKLYIKGSPISLMKFNFDSTREPPLTIVDLPNYCWNHSTKYWHETASSKDWRFRKFIQHDLLGMKVLGTPWTQPTFQKTLKVKDLPWLEEHKAQDNVVFPATGYISMAVEALFQLAKATGRIPAEKSVREVAYRLRNIKFFKAMVMAEGVDQDIVLSMNPRHGSKDTWYEFTVSTRTDASMTEHCSGQISTIATSLKDGNASEIQHIQHGVPGELWYKVNDDMGMSYGPSFRKMITVECTAGQRRNRVLVNLESPESKYAQSKYSIHPAVLDVAFQAVNMSLWEGMRSEVSAVLLPAIVSDLYIPALSHSYSHPKEGILVAQSKFTGAGNQSDPKSYASNIAIYDMESGKNLVEVQGLQFHRLERNPESLNEPGYCRLVWRPDVTFLSQTGLDAVLAEECKDQASAINRILDLVAFKTPDIKVMEVNMTDQHDSIWICGRGANGFDRLACSQLQIFSRSGEAMNEVTSRYNLFNNVEVGSLEALREATDNAKVDLIIIRASTSAASDTLSISALRKQLQPGGQLLILRPIAQNTFPILLDDAGLSIKFQTLIAADVHNPISMRFTLAINCEEEKEQVGDGHGLYVTVAHFSSEQEAGSTLISALGTAGWDVRPSLLPFTDIIPKSTIIVYEESPILPEITDEQWIGLQTLLANECRILWVTQGSQMLVTEPERSLIHGLARTICNEDPSSIIMTLDVESLSGTNTCAAVQNVLLRLNQANDSVNIDTEFIERSGTIYVGRVIPDKVLNEHEKPSSTGPQDKLRPENLFHHASQVRLISQHQGTLDGLCWSASSSPHLSKEEELSEGYVEVEMHSVGLNFKDVAVSMGLVPGDTTLLGLEGAGTIIRTAINNATHTIGQRVFVNSTGTLVNRRVCDVHEVISLPEWMTFEEASTLSVYQTALYCLVDLADMRKGKSVLIHSAAGGVGLAAIQICHYLGAEIYATVGNASKRQFLTQTYGIPEERILSSRSPDFEHDLMNMTGGRGVAVVLNSLTGEILHASWRCIAVGGIFVEIGKKDILDRSSISMEPFNRGASYRAFDYSHARFTPEVRAGVLKRVFDLLEAGYIRPLHIEKTFHWKDVAKAFRHMASGSNIGKTIITRSEDEQGNSVPVQAAPTALRFNHEASYLIVGGLKGLCGSLAVYLARKGAKNLVVLSRSGYEDSMSKTVLRDLAGLGAHVDLIIGDVTKLEDVERALHNATKPVRGIVQGAMLLQDGIYAAMSATDFRSVLEAKVKGTWNLHNAILKLGIRLDFFTLLSSISGITGSKGQANYSVANTFLDSFAHYRHGLGLPACSINLGVIDDVGYVVGKEDLAKHLYSQGWPGIKEAQLHRILALSILQQSQEPIHASSAAQLITGLPMPLPSHSPAMRDPRFSALRTAATNSSQDTNSGGSSQSSAAALRKALQSPSTADNKQELLDLLTQLVNTKLTRALGMDSEIDPARPMSNYGINSLVAVEFGNWARQELGVEVSTLEFVNARTLGSLAEGMLGRGLKCA
ncbi:polyketide synthase [Lophiotrema nucula]|uniref:Polyketide synthase n=1 Tax=Lophiotrema nucula TaxID=690887 RepID=A0A6A5YS53_9PLEO|nr:polyketide synthase [Lophiotrema nucula]